jgi:hypothetical protein
MKFLGVLCVLCGLAFPSAALDRHAFTFTRYNLNATIEPGQQRLGVRGKITLRNDSDAPQKNLALQISSTLNWVSIRFEGKPAEFVSQTYTSDIDHTGALTEAVVVLPRGVPYRQSIDLEIGYEGTIPQDATRLTRIGVPADTAKHSDWDQIGRTFTAVRGIGYVAWYPIATEAVSLSEGNSVFEEVGRWKQREVGAEMRITFIHSDSTGSRPILFCNDRGSVLGEENVGRAYSVETECRFQSVGTTAPLFLIGNYDVLDKPAVNISYLSGHKSGADDYALAVEQIAPLISKWFGDHRDKPEYKAEVVELLDPAAAPFESGAMLLAPLTGDETTILLSALRQITHLYFPSPRTWISEGLAGFAQANYFLNEKGRDAALTYLQSHRTALVQTEKGNLSRAGDHSAETSLINAPDEFYVQTKAMNAWWMLRDIVGDIALTAALHKYDSRDDTSADYMQKLIEAQSHRDLKWFFDYWVYRDRGLPNLRIANVYTSPIQHSGYMVTVTVENSGTAGAQVPVTVHMSRGEATEQLIVAGNAKASVRIVAVAVPEEINVNDGSVPESEGTSHTYKIEANH